MPLLNVVDIKSLVTGANKVTPISSSYQGMTRRLPAISGPTGVTSYRDVVNGRAEKVGLTPLYKGDTGEAYIKGSKGEILFTDLFSPGATFDSVLNTLSTRVFDAAELDAYGNNLLTLHSIPTKSLWDKTKAQSKAALVASGRYATNPALLISDVTNMVKAMASKNFGLAVLGASTLALLIAYELKKEQLDDKVANGTGCFIFDSNTGELAGKVSGDESLCTCGGVAPGAQLNETLKAHAYNCNALCTAEKNTDSGLQTDWKACGASCACRTKTGDLHAQQYKFEWRTMDLEDALSITLADYLIRIKAVGPYGLEIENVSQAEIDADAAAIAAAVAAAEAAKKAAEAALAAANSTLKIPFVVRKYWWVGVIGVVVIITAIVLAVTLPPRNKLKGGRARRRVPPLLLPPPLPPLPPSSFVSSFPLHY